jgi:hypothetical protein
MGPLVKTDFLSHANADPYKSASNLVPEFHMGSNSSTFTGLEILPVTRFKDPTMAI